MGKRISFIFGTRPEAIKLAPVILALKNDARFAIDVCVTAQHRSMLDQVLEIFNIVPDTDLNIMKPNQSLAEITSNAIARIDGYLVNSKPDIVLVQGDTTTVLAAALASFYHKIPVGHVEAGLRTFNKYSPFPEEINRVMTTHVAELHFAPTELSKENLVREGIAESKIFVTGNTVIDALLIAKEKIAGNPPGIDGIPESFMSGKDPIVLITGHRRENFGGGFESMCNAILELSKKFLDHRFIYPVHLNPNVREPVFRLLGSSPNISLVEPLSYLPFVRLMLRTKLILTDSGGIQEEAPTFGIPVLVMRDTTERPEGVQSGTVKLVGTEQQSIVGTVSELLLNDDAYQAMASAANPYGDGKATKRIIHHLAEYLGNI
ncbi:MAG: UDP-N-acetylglucosamine 2-epimerase (non-hydrolyzing) [Bacteriovoracaceae bacterium]|nr:UDP-N-acetylglucosamine 2-epimerase (non-hydrolyzing) [Bacteroidota bacterium]